MERSIAMPSTDDRPLWDAWLSCVRLPAVLAADDLRLFDALAEAPASAAELAERLGLNGHALASVLPLLAALGLLTARDGRYAPSEAGRLYMRQGAPLYWGDALGVMRDMPLVTVLRDVLTDKAGRRHYQAAQAWADGHIAKEAALGAARVMQSQSHPTALGLAASGMLSGVSRLLDVGGGSGCFAIALARRHPDMRCAVLDLPAMCGAAAGYVASAGVGDRVETLPLDMFREDWPQGFDAVLLSNVFHDWDANANARLAARAFSALPAGGRIHVHEMLLDDDGTGPLPAASFSVMLLLAANGRQYAAREVAAILGGAGFVEVEARPAYGYYSLVSARKP